MSFREDQGSWNGTAALPIRLISYVKEENTTAYRSGRSAKRAARCLSRFTKVPAGERWVAAGMPHDMPALPIMTVTSPKWSDRAPAVSVRAGSQGITPPDPALGPIGVAWVPRCFRFALIAGVALAAFHAQAEPVTNAAAQDNGHQLPAREPGLLYATDFPGVDRTGKSDSTAGINRALDVLESYNNACLWFPDGTYTISGPLVISRNRTCLRGSSSHTVHIVSLSTTEDVVHVRDGVSQYRISDILLTRTGPATSGAGLHVGERALGEIENVASEHNYYGFELGPTSNSRCDKCQAYYNFASGFYLAATDSAPFLQWEMVNDDSEFNDGWGFLSVAAPGKDTLYATWLHPRTFANGSGGIGFLGNAAGTTSDLFLRDVIGSTDDGDEIEIANVGNNVRVAGCTLELAGTEKAGRAGNVPASLTGRGINLLSGNGIGVVQISDCITQHNSQQGLYVGARLAAVTVSNFLSLSNAQHTHGAGITLASPTTPVSLSNVTSINDTGAPQTYGLEAANASNVTTSASRYDGSVGGCRASSGAFHSAAVIGSGCAR